MSRPVRRRADRRAVDGGAAAAAGDRAAQAGWRERSGSQPCRDGSGPRCQRDGPTAPPSAARLIDPYFRFPQLDDLLGSSVIRVLTSTKIKPQGIAHLELALGVLPPGEGPEIKTVSRLHDRFAISQEGHVIALGSSIGSSRQNIGAVVELHGRAGEAAREAHEALWADAVPVTPRVPADGSSVPTPPQVGGDE